MQKFLGAVGDQCQVSSAIDGHAGRLLAGLHRGDHGRRRSGQIDDIDLEGREFETFQVRR